MDAIDTVKAYLSIPVAKGEVAAIGRKGFAETWVLGKEPGYDLAGLRVYRDGMHPFSAASSRRAKNEETRLVLWILHEGGTMHSREGQKAFEFSPAVGQGNSVVGAVLQARLVG